VPHHVTQRGNHRQQIFFQPGDQASYLSLLRDQAEYHGVRIIAYCLMPNHVHHVVVPSSASGLHRLFKAVHGQYAQRINRMRGLRGHLWQGRYFSSPLDGSYFSNAIRYVELNPVRAGIVERAENFEWSSAAAHCGLRHDLVVDATEITSMLKGIGDWSQWLANGVTDESIAAIRRQGSQNLPCGSPEFIEQLERCAGVPLQYRPHGGPRTPSRNAKAEGSGVLSGIQ
jgi:putative transposase